MDDETGLHANIRCYVLDLTNEINQPLTRRNIETHIPGLSLEDLQAARETLFDAAPDDDWHPQIDELLEFIEGYIDQQI